MPFRFNPFTNNLDWTPDLSGYVPYVGATADLNLGLFNIVDNANLVSIDPDLRSLYNSAGDKSLNYAIGQLLSTPSTPSLDWVNYQLFDSLSGLSQDWKEHKLYATNGIDFTVDYGNRTLNYNSVAIFDWQTTYLSDLTGGWAIKVTDRHLMDTTGNHAIVDWGNQNLKDSSGFKAMDFNTSQRQLYDFGGSYPSVDYGYYYLMNINFSNGVPMLDWSNATGGGVWIYNASSNFLAGDFTNCQLLYAGGLHVDWQNCFLGVAGQQALNWFNRQAKDSSGIVTIDWENKYLYSDAFGGVISVDYGDHLLNNGGGFLSINFTDHTLFDQSGSVKSGDYHNRYLVGSDGTTNVLTWGDASFRVGILTTTPTASLDVEGDFKFGVGGSVLTSVLATTATLDFPSTSTYSDLTVTVTGAAVGDVVSVGVPDACMFSHTCYFGWVSAADTVTVRFLVVSSGPHNPPSDDFKVLVTKF